MSKENRIPVKVSKKGKEFLRQMQINRIKLDLPELSYPQCLEVIADYFKTNNDSYLEMLKEVKNVRD